MHTPKKQFQSLGLSSYLIEAITDAGYQQPTWVQKNAIPIILKGSDILVEAQTGTGKTAAFALPAIQKACETTHPHKGIHTLVLTPTRELAVQVEDFFNTYAKHTPSKTQTVSIIGGVDYVDQTTKIDVGANIVIATPGRLGDFLKSGFVCLDHISTFVIDEADKLLNMGFAKEIETILKVLPLNKQTLLFSATFPEKVESLAKRILIAPVLLRKKEAPPTVDRIRQRVIEVNRDNRRSLLQHLVKTEKWQHVLIFVASKKATTNLARKLSKNGISAAALHGNLIQAERTRTLQIFKDRQIQVLVATDIATRGIDFQKLSHVVNFDLPRSPADYIHRIGRTGRAGENGIAVTFVHPQNMDHFGLIKKRAQIRLTKEQVPGFFLTDEGFPQKKSAPIKGKRKSKKDKLREAKLKIHSKDGVKSTK